MKFKNVCFLIPHTPTSRGAMAWNGIREYDYYYNILLHSKFQVNGKKGFEEYFDIADQLVSLGFTTAIEPHFNAFNGRAAGAEILVMKGDQKSKNFARYLLGEFELKFPNRRLRYNAGVKELEEGDRGHSILTVLKNRGFKIAVIPELFFGDNKEDYIKPKDLIEFFENVL